MQGLESEIAEKAQEVEVLRAAVVEVEADALASAEEKAALRREYEQRIAAVQHQMASLKKQLKDQVS
jgi:outer membrane lipopolysaccharide assembly protein LptE/RlpB